MNCLPLSRASLHISDWWHLQPKHMAGKLVYQRWSMETWNKWRCCHWLEHCHQYLESSVACLTNLIIMPQRSIPVQSGQKLANQKLWLWMLVNIKGKTNSITKLYLELLASLLPFLSIYFPRFLEYPALNLSKLYLPYCNGGKIKIRGIISYKVIDTR